LRTRIESSSAAKRSTSRWTARSMMKEVMPLSYGLFLDRDLSGHDA
jgi:hypothetical protein